MKRKRFSPEKIIRMLRETEASLSHGLTVGKVSRQLGISEQTHYRWQKQYGGMKISQAKRMKELQNERMAD
jgi:transposase-like protein